LAEKRYARVSPGRRLRILRELNELTQEQLARASGLTQATLSALETGTKTLGVERAKKLARPLHVHPAVLVFSDWVDSPVRAKKSA
jgi:transcriptional regulator with XRE-family HTH domain